MDQPNTIRTIRTLRGPHAIEGEQHRELSQAATFGRDSSDLSRSRLRKRHQQQVNEIPPHGLGSKRLIDNMFDRF